MQVSKIAVSSQFSVNKNQKTKVQNQQSFGWTPKAALEAARANALSADAIRWQASLDVKEATNDIARAAAKVRLKAAEKAHLLAERGYHVALAEAYPITHAY